MEWTYWIAILLVGLLPSLRFTVWGEFVMSALLNLHVNSVWRNRGQPLYMSLMQAMKLLSARAWMPYILEPSGFRSVLVCRLTFSCLWCC